MHIQTTLKRSRGVDKIYWRGLLVFLDIPSTVESNAYKSSTSYILRIRKEATLVAYILQSTGRMINFRKSTWVVVRIGAVFSCLVVPSGGNTIGLRHCQPLGGRLVSRV